MNSNDGNVVATFERAPRRTGMQTISKSLLDGDCIRVVLSYDDVIMSLTTQRVHVGSWNGSQDDENFIFNASQHKSRRRKLYENIINVISRVI